MTIAVAQLLVAWSEAFRSPGIAEMTPGRVWELATERGDRYVLKQVSTFDAADPARRFTAEARILTHLVQCGIPVAVPVLSNDGRPYTTDEDGALYAVFPMLPQGNAGSDPGLDPTLFQNVGAAIGRLHLALADCPYGIESWEVGPDVLNAMWQRMKDRLPHAELSELTGRVLPQWETIVEALSATPQRVHGDVHGANILTDGQKVTGIIDSDHLPLAPRGYDLAYYMAFGVHWRLDGNAPSQPVDQATPFITRHLLTGYNAVSRLSRQENDGLPALSLVAALSLIDFFVRKYDLVEESWLHTANWIGDNLDALRLPVSAFDV